ncbi:hypothetical protein Hamer_G022171 [Homarus americanus]|uniref:Uncharacterized protein n=1 Tax=Homarus americanus TaxID=6706 RepID=A0A8J5N867_HOMAM|nr:hypothetical protein Hamer_G022171 [Homarus americanus]
MEYSGPATLADLEADLAISDEIYPLGKVGPLLRCLATKPLPPPNAHWSPFQTVTENLHLLPPKPQRIQRNRPLTVSISTSRPWMI